VTLYEIIDGLIDANDLLLKANERVPMDERNQKDYQDDRKEIHDDLATIEDVKAVCYHEASHLIYATNVAFAFGIDPSKFRIIGPHVKYHPSKAITERYEPTTSAIKAPGLESLPDTNAALEELAKIAVAGGESVAHFAKLFDKPMWKRGDKGDRSRFINHAKAVSNKVGRGIEPGHIYWNGAAILVGKDFELELYDSDIKRDATLAMFQVFPGVFSNMKETL
jgi:hypothetical protein